MLDFRREISGGRLQEGGFRRVPGLVNFSLGHKLCIIGFKGVSWILHMRSHNGLVTDCEAGYSEAVSVVGFATPIPPSHEGKANRSHLLSFGGTFPVRALLK